MPTDVTDKNGPRYVYVLVAFCVETNARVVVLRSALKAKAKQQKDKTRLRVM